MNKKPFSLRCLTFLLLLLLLFPTVCLVGGCRHSCRGAECTVCASMRLCCRVLFILALVWSTASLYHTVLVARRAFLRCRTSTWFPHTLHFLRVKLSD